MGKKTIKSLAPNKVGVYNDFYTYLEPNTGVTPITSISMGGGKKDSLSDVKTSALLSLEKEDQKLANTDNYSNNSEYQRYANTRPSDYNSNSIGLSSNSSVSSEDAEPERFSYTPDYELYQSSYQEDNLPSTEIPEFDGLASSVASPLDEKTVIIAVNFRASCLSSRGRI